MKKYEVDYVQIKDKKMMRDMKSKAIVNTNIEELRAHRDRKQAMRNIDDAMLEINNTKKEITEIKDMLNKLMSIVSERK